MRTSQAAPKLKTGLVALANGIVFKGDGVGHIGETVGEVCFNTAITGYQEILTDPSYAGQIVTFTFPHIGNVGINNEDMENAGTRSVLAARGGIFRANITNPSNYRSQVDLPAWLKRRGIIGITNVDTRALTALIREEGMQHGIIAHNPSGEFDIPTLIERARAWEGIDGADLARDMTSLNSYGHQETGWQIDTGYGRFEPTTGAPHIVVIDYGVKRNILRRLAQEKCVVTVLPATASKEDIMALNPDGVVLSNGPGDPSATGEYAVPVIRALLEDDIPILGICLGHQLLAIALGAETIKMDQGHHGANHPVKDLATGKVEIVSMNHGFAVNRESLPTNIEETHISLFDGSNCGIMLKGKPVFSVQHHPEASPGPQDSFYLFNRFITATKKAA